LTKSAALDGRKYNIAVSQIDIGKLCLARVRVDFDPTTGNCNTSMGSRFLDGVPQANGSISVEPVFEVEHAAAAVVAMASLPLAVNILNQTIVCYRVCYAIHELILRR